MATFLGAATADVCSPLFGGFWIFRRAKTSFSGRPLCVSATRLLARLLWTASLGRRCWTWRRRRPVVRLGAIGPEAASSSLHAGKPTRRVVLHLRRDTSL